MKQRSTTPVIKSVATKSILVAAAVMMVAAAPFSAIPNASADQFDDKINALQQQVNQYQGTANELNARANTLQGQVSALQQQMAVIQGEIDLSQAQLDKLAQQIIDTEKKIVDNKDALGTTLADMYVDSTISPLEMLASAKNIGDYVDKQSYRSAVNDQLQSTIAKINTLKANLVKDKAQVETVIAKQQSQRGALDATRAEQQTLLDQTKGEEASYQSLIANAKARMDEAAAAQRAYWANHDVNAGGSAGVGGGYGYTGPAPQGPFVVRPGSFSGNSSCGGGYPGSATGIFGGVWGCNYSMDTSYVDSWALYNRQCVSYTSWALANRFNKRVYSFSGAGMAYQYGSTAVRSMGATFNNTPAVGAVAVLPPIPGYADVGHVMIVESILSDGWIHVSQYNFNGTGQYSEMDIKASGATYVHFP